MVLRRLHIYLLLILIGSALAFQHSAIRVSDAAKKPFNLLVDASTRGAVRRRKHWMDSPPRILTLKSKNGDIEPQDSTVDASSWKWLALVLPLHLVYVSNQWSRSSIYYLVNFSDGASPFTSMNVDIGFSQSEYGLLASLGFTSLFAIASLFAGAAADRLDRKLITVTSALGWGGATLGTALFSSSFTDVLFFRVWMGIFCAFSTPAAYTLINERVPEDRRSFATSLYGTGVALGGAFASLSILLDTQFGWRQTTMLVALVAFTSAGLAFAILPDDNKEDNTVVPRAGESKVEERNFFHDISDVLSTDRAKWLFFGSFLRFSAGLSIGVWSAPYYKQAFPENAEDYAVAQALITALAGSASGLIGGAIADWLSANTQEGGDIVGKKLWVPVVGSVLAAPTFYLAVHAESFQTAMVWLSIEYLVAECWFGPTISFMLGTVGKKVGGTGQGLFTLTGAVANLVPAALGWYYSAGTAGDASSDLSSVLSSIVCLAYMSSAICFAISAKTPIMLANEKQS